jgi:hypothetical protein
MSHIPGKAAAAAALCIAFIWVVPAAVAGVPRSGAAHVRSPLTVGNAHYDPAQPASAQSLFGQPRFAPAALTDIPGNMTWGGGPVQHNATFYAVFWLPSGAHYEPGVINGDSGYENLMTRYLKDSSSTNLANVVSQYTDSQGNIAPSYSFGGSWTDTTAYPSSGSTSAPLQDGDLRDAVNRALAANPGWQDGTNATYFVFTGSGIQMCLDSSLCTPAVNSPGGGFCGYHSHFGDTRGSTAVYAAMPDDVTLGLSSGGAGCLHTGALPNGDIYADTEFTTLAHEQFEAMTDPLVNLHNGWGDPAGDEIGDKCADDYGSQPYFGPSNYDIGGDLYYLQQMWSNVDSACGGSINPPSGFAFVYGPFSATAGRSTGTLILAKTSTGPNALGAPAPTIDWGDGSSSTSDTSGCNVSICDLPGSHVYAAAGTYHVTVTWHAGCCIPNSASLYIVVFPAPTLTVTANASGQYGTAPNLSGLSPGNPAIGYSLGSEAANVTGALTCSTTAVASSPAGSYPISNCTGLSDPGFDIVYDYFGSSYSVTQAPLTVTADNQSRPYGSANPPLTATLSGFVLGQNLATSGVTGAAACSTTATASSPVGTYMITCSQGTLSSANYSFNPFVAGTMTVTKVPLTVTADNQSRSYGSSNPPLTATLSGFVLGQDLATSGVTGTASCTTTAASSSPGGSYPITCTQGSLSSANYSFAPFVPGTLTVTKVALTVTADNQSRPYGSANPPLTATLSGFVLGQNLASSDVTGAASCSTSATSSSSGGSYPITCTQGSLSSADYSFGPFPTGTLTVTKVALTVTADNQSRQFGSANPLLTATLSGFVLGQNLASSDVTGTASCATTATTYSPGGSYPITCTKGTLSSADYSFMPFVPGTLTVTFSATCVSGTTTKVTVAPGQAICIAAGAQINGPVTVAAGGSLDLEGATITGPIFATGAAVVRICGTTSSGALMVTGSTGLVLAGGDAATGPCAHNTFGGAVSITGNSGGVEFNGNTVTGSLTITGNTGTLPPPDPGSVHAAGNTVSGKSKIQS